MERRNRVTWALLPLTSGILSLLLYLPSRAHLYLFPSTSSVSSRFNFCLDGMLRLNATLIPLISLFLELLATVLMLIMNGLFFLLQLLFVSYS